MNNNEMLKKIKKSEKDIVKLNEQLDNKTKQLDNKIEEVANKGTTVEVLEKVTKEEIERQMDDGTIANLTIKDYTLSKNKLKRHIIGFEHLDCFEEIDKPSINIATTENLVRGKFINGNGEYNDREDSVVTDFIKVYPNMTYMRNYVSWEIAFYDKYYNIIPNDINFANPVFTVPNNEKIAYMKTNIHVGEITTFMIVEGEKFPDNFIPFKKGKGVLDSRIKVTNDNFQEDSNIDINYTTLIDKTLQGNVNPNFNLFNKNSLLRDHYLSISTGEMIESPNIHTSTHIPVEEETTYCKKPYPGLGITFYDKTETFIGGVNCDETGLIRTPKRCKFIRITVTVDTLNDDGVFLGDKIPEQISDKNYLSVIKKDIQITKDNLTNDIIENCGDINPNYNLFNKNTIVRDHYLSITTGELVPLIDAHTSAYIPLEENKSYCKKPHEGLGITFYDKTQTFISGYNCDETGLIKPPPNARFVRITVNEDKLNDEGVFCSDTIPDEMSNEKYLPSLSSQIKVSRNNFTSDIIEDLNKPSVNYNTTPLIQDRKGNKYSIVLDEKTLTNKPIKIDTNTVMGRSRFNGQIYYAHQATPVLNILDPNGANIFNKTMDNGVFIFEKHHNSRGEVRYVYGLLTGEPLMNTNGGYNNIEYFIVDENFEIIKGNIRLKQAGNVPEGYPCDGHDFVYIDDNHYIIMSYHGHIIEDVNGLVGKFKAVNCVIQEHINDVVVMHWESCNYPETFIHSCFNNDFSNFGVDQDVYNDYFHLNSIEIDPKDNNLLLSARHCGLLKINRNNGDIMWIFGREGRMDFDGMTKYHCGYLQHDAKYTDDGRITIFDNSGCLSNNTRVCVYTLDEENMKLIDFKEYITDRPRSGHMGSATLLEDETFLICYGGGMKVLFEEIDFREKKINYKMDNVGCAYRVWIDTKMLK